MKKSPLLVLFLTVFIDLLGFGIVIPFLPYYAREYGATGKLAGFVVGVYSLMQFFFAPIWGRLSDRVGRRPILIVSLTGSMLGYTIFAFANSLTSLLVARIIAGIAAANIGTAQAYIADVTTPQNRARGMGIIGAAFGLGFILGPPLGGILSSLAVSHGHHGNLYPGAFAALLSLTAVTVALVALPESRPESLRGKGSRRPPQFDPRIWRFVFQRGTLTLILGTLFLIVLAFAGMETSVTLVGRDRFGFQQMDFAWLFLFMGVIVAGIQGGAIGRIVRAVGERNAIVAGAFSLAVGFLLVPSIVDARFLYLAALFIALGQAVCYPSLMSLVTKVTPSEEHGSMLGISSSIGSLSRILGPILGGALYDAGGTSGAFYTSAGIILGAFLLALALRRRPIETGMGSAELTESRP
ncbi:MAG TPA: MFS transporter [Thermoanaerobaculia bacterium]|nr:MFS transporter [Thermoanaerobaculia bacterium]